MKKVFVDLGAYDGDTVREFYNWGKLTGDPMSMIFICLSQTQSLLTS